MAQSRLKLNDLRKIINEELVTMREQVDHAGMRDVVTGASKLLAAVEAFKETAPASAVNAVTPHIDQLATTLEDMVSTPGSYVAKVKPKIKKVSLRNVAVESKQSSKDE